MKIIKEPNPNTNIVILFNIEISSLTHLISNFFTYTISRFIIHYIGFFS